MLLLARAITQKFSTPINKCLLTSSNTRNQAVIQDGRVDIQTKNTGYGGNGNKNAGRQNINQAFNVGTGNDKSNQIVQRVPLTKCTPEKENVQCYNCNEKAHYARDCQKPRVPDAKYFREQMLLAVKDKAGSNLNNEENDFMLDNSYGEETMEELTVAAVSEVNALTKVHEQVRHVKCKTIIQTSDDDQIDSNIIFDDPYVENNGGTSKHDSNAHDEYHEIQMLAYNVQRESENKKRLNNELKKKKELLQKELDTSINSLRTRIDKTLLEDRKRRWMSDSQNSSREFYKTNVILISASLSKNLKELKELSEEVEEMLNIFESIEQKVNGRSPKENIL
ncbi:retrovirus-related pol polyprotein from transposon TNT 1-94 [Tanacetum coccineum]